MNRPNKPRNRQPRPPRQGTQQGSSRSSRAPATPQQSAGTVPNIQQVTPGASVFIVLKEDQPTGNETHGIVQDLLTRGNHPRGIKVRLRGGQVGRVQRMGDASLVEALPESTGSTTASGGQGNERFAMKYTDVRRDDEFASEPPPRSLADYIPDVAQSRQTVAAVTCPFCDGFEGDEVAVTHHIDREHLS